MPFNNLTDKLKGGIIQGVYAEGDYFFGEDAESGEPVILDRSGKVAATLTRPGIPDHVAPITADRIIVHYNGASSEVFDVATGLQVTIPGVDLSDVDRMDSLNVGARSILAVAKGRTVNLHDFDPRTIDEGIESRPFQLPAGEGKVEELMVGFDTAKNQSYVVTRQATHNAIGKHSGSSARNVLVFGEPILGKAGTDVLMTFKTSDGQTHLGSWTNPVASTTIGEALGDGGFITQLIGSNDRLGIVTSNGNKKSTSWFSLSITSSIELVKERVLPFGNTMILTEGGTGFVKQDDGSWSSFLLDGIDPTASTAFESLGPTVGVQTGDTEGAGFWAALGAGVVVLWVGAAGEISRRTGLLSVGGAKNAKRVLSPCFRGHDGQVYSLVCKTESGNAKVFKTVGMWLARVVAFNPVLILPIAAVGVGFCMRSRIGPRSTPEVEIKHGNGA